MVRTPRLSERAQAAAIAAQCACFHLRKATRTVTQLYDRVLRPTRLRITQFTLLTLIAGFGTIGVTSLAKVAVMDHTTLVRNLQLLERAGLVRSRPGRDRRERQVVLTKRGRQRLAPARRLWADAQAVIAGTLGRERLGRLLADLTATVGAVSDS